MSQSLTERHDDRIAGMLSCYDRLVISGTLPVMCSAAGMTEYPHGNSIRVFYYPQFAMALSLRHSSVRHRGASSRWRNALPMRPGKKGSRW